jgi:beta-glucosidase
VPIELTAAPHKVLVEFWSKAGFPAPLFRMGIKRDGTWVNPKVVAMAAKANVAVLSVGFDPTTEFEGWDRTFHLPLGQEELIEKVTAVNPNTIVVLQGGGNVDMARWLDKVQAILHAWYPGQEGGTAIAEVLLGSTNPSGHLPVTFEQKREDNPTFGNYYPDAADMSPTPKVEYREGVFVGYRGYDRNKVHPMFSFGFGLSYTSFAFSHLQLERAAPDGDAIFQASVNVSNTGKRSGKVAVQMYVSPSKSEVPRPEKELRGFAKIELAAGETRNVVLPLTARAFSYYDVKSKTWIAPAGSYEIRMGESSEDVQVRGVVRIPEAISSK